jgi:hypothetical protein
MKIKKISIVLCFINALLLSQFSIAESPACTSCVRGYACDRYNKMCQKSCEANLYTEAEDLQACSEDCTSDWSKCQTNAKKSCGSYYCGAG